MAHLSTPDKVAVERVVTEHGLSRVVPRHTDALAHVEPDAAPAGVYEDLDAAEAWLGRQLLGELAAMVLTARDRAVIMGWLAGDSLGDIGRAVGLSPERVRQVVLTIVYRLRDRSPSVRRVEKPGPSGQSWDVIRTWEAS